MAGAWGWREVSGVAEGLIKGLPPPPLHVAAKHLAAPGPCLPSPHLPLSLGWKPSGSLPVWLGLVEAGCRLAVSPVSLTSPLLSTWPLVPLGIILHLSLVPSPAPVALGTPLPAPVRWKDVAWMWRDQEGTGLSGDHPRRCLAAVQLEANFRVPVRLMWAHTGQARTWPWQMVPASLVEGPIHSALPGLLRWESWASNSGT